MSKMYKCVECDCNFISTDTDPETLCKWCMNESPDRAKIKELENKLEIAINALNAIDCSNDDMKYFNSEINNIVRFTLEKIKADK